MLWILSIWGMQIPLLVKNTFLEYDLHSLALPLRRVKSESYIHSLPEILQLTPLGKEEIESHLVELAIVRAKSEPNRPSKEFEKKAIVWFNKLLQRYHEASERMPVRQNDGES